MGFSLNVTQIWIELFVFAGVSESVSVDIRGSRCGGIKASARGSWSRQSSSCSSSPAFISHCESFRTNLLSHVFMGVTDGGVASRHTSLSLSHFFHTR